MVELQATANELVESLVLIHRSGWYRRILNGQKKNDLMLLLHLRRQEDLGEPDMRVSDISKLLQVTSPTVTQMLNPLENKHFIHRYVDRVDRRVIRVTLTEEGRKFTDETVDSIRKQLNHLVEYLGEADSLQLVLLMRKISEYREEASSILAMNDQTGDEKEC
ncbi:MarR family winged helix-turn-helix transcriptional regulator [Paenibacillus sp. 1001270B_150601_E10]|uniref:MarR family winged helix-turn-helix transcriptional regulator n=1 Tax=Paenibacillus sp. 1001270B_150601_E10 TaxID=2787079 RepID=UPI001E413842|nr:MarR family transcriptional regulator [Paenibacillus sp. 1001270B_150601_E10]